MASLSLPVVARVFMRSLALQASWSFEGMQGLGFAYAMDPALRRLYGEGSQYRAAVERHLGFFNTHPFFAAAVVGGCLRLEAEGGDGIDGAVRGLKDALMGPCGAMGDPLYWGGLKPLWVILAVLAAYRGALWAPFVLVAGFGGCNLVGRLAAFRAGYDRGAGVVSWLVSLDALLWARRCKAAAAGVLGLAVAFCAGATPAATWGVSPIVWGAGAGLAVVVLSVLVARGVRAEWLVYVSAGVSFCLVGWW